MKSCEKCLLFLNGCPVLDGCDYEGCGYKPDYPALESENSEFKQIISILEMALGLATYGKTEYENYIDQATSIINTNREKGAEK